MHLGGGGIEKIVLVSGVTGLDLKRIIDIARGITLPESLRGRVGFYKFESILRRVSRSDIDVIASYLIESKPAAIQSFNRAAEIILGDMEENDYLAAYIAIHLSYYTNNTIIPNPVLNLLISSAREAVILYFVDDYYSGLSRIKDRLKERIRETTWTTIPEYTIDPLTYLMWRGLDHNILSLLASMHGNLEYLVVGLKHPIATHERLLKYAVMPRNRGRMTFYHVYFSHPITMFRMLYNQLSDGAVDSLASIPGVKEMELLKRTIIEEFPEIILYEPTTIDEDIPEPIYMVKRELVSEGICGDLGEKELRDEYLKKENIFSLIIGSRNRWPVSPDWLDNPGIYANLLSEDFADLFGVFYQLLRKDYCEVLTSGNTRSYVLSTIENLVRTQIRMRDYEYVMQSSALITYKPLYVDISRLIVKEHGGTGNILNAGKLEASGEIDIYPIHSTGSTAEIRRAQSFAKPIYILYDFIFLNPAINERDKEIINTVSKMTSKITCPAHGVYENMDLLEAKQAVSIECVKKMQRNINPFETGSGVRTFYLHPKIISGDINYSETVREFIKLLK